MLFNLHTYKQGKNMKNTSLINLTFVVIVSTVASSFVSAEDTIAKPDKQLLSISSVNKEIKFSQFDTNKNGLLNFEETKKNEVLNEAFTKIDSNGDATISPDEFSSFFKKSS